MKRFLMLITLVVFAYVLCACSNVPQAPTKTPTQEPPKTTPTAA